MVKHAFTGDNDDEMSVRVGETVEIVRTAGGGWIVARKANGAEGVQAIRIHASILHMLTGVSIFSGEVLRTCMQEASVLLQSKVVRYPTELIYIIYLHMHNVRRSCPVNLPPHAWG